MFAEDKVSVPAPALVSAPEVLEESITQPTFMLAEEPTSKTREAPPKVMRPAPAAAFVKSTVEELLTRKSPERTIPCVATEALL